MKECTASDVDNSRGRIQVTLLHLIVLARPLLEVRGNRFCSLEVLSQLLSPGDVLTLKRLSLGLLPPTRGLGAIRWWNNYIKSAGSPQIVLLERVHCMESLVISWIRMPTQRSILLDHRTWPLLDDLWRGLTI